MMRCGSLLLAAVLLLIGAPMAHADREFSVAFSQNVRGNIAIAANSQMTCPESAECAVARTAPATFTGAAPDWSINNDWFEELFVGATPPFTNSSSAQLALPAGASVLSARLYWFGAGEAPPAGSTVRLVTPAANVAVSPTKPYDLSTYGYYQGIADVTAAVAAGGGGRYTVADIPGVTGTGKAAGWALVVAYGLGTEPARNLTVFDGLRTVNEGDPPRDIDVTGFQTPKTGPVRTTVGFITYEGDRGVAGDGAAIADVTGGPAVPTFQPLANATNPATNLFNSTVSTGGIEVAGREPGHSNTLGMDADLIDATGALGNDATAARVRLTTFGDVYLPAVVTFATELHMPDVTQTMTVTDSTGGKAVPGDVLTYEVTGSNGGQDGAVDLAVADRIPAGTTYVPGSASITPAAGTATFDAAADTVRFAAPAIASGGTYTARFQVKVGAGETAITNTADTTYKGATMGLPVALSSSTTTERGVALALPEPTPGPDPTPLPGPGPVVVPAPPKVDLTRACSQRPLVLLNVLERSGRVTLVGAADTALAGQTVGLHYADGRQVAKTTIAADGSFSTTAPLPPKAHRGTTRARYSARVGRQRSPELKLTRRVVVEPPVVRAGSVRLRGRVVAPFARPRAQIVITQQLTCGGAETPVARVKPDARGAFTATVAVPAGAPAAIYRVSTRVQRSTSNPKTFPTFGLPQAVELG
ncbi:DUF11 domain-containing protein [Solirubrobacter phytolaccae]|uniref:DUF11 domain-containing protein n=1 Tax=Solirubrobacter phytolaccae TaxID=1404360 RepID=A0A9X3S943_9ACTN|nr:hypothetical protein [Solirubrobacter phytolaccae]MDA0182959.1 DUF11 domain-containing protein [Solirubrobacter phytolaccae]